MSGSSNQPNDETGEKRASLRSARALSAAILLAPPLLAFAAAAFPGSVPVPFVETGAVRGMRSLLVGVGILLLALNAAFLWLFWNIAENTSE